MQTRKLLLTLTLTLMLIAIPMQIFMAKNVNAQLTKPVVILGFSDGYESQYTIGYPYLQTYGYKAFIMVIANLTDKNAKFESQDLMNWTQINFLETKGYNLVSHSYNHIQIASKPSTPTEILQETNVSQTLIKNETGTKPYIFCIPFGDRNATVNGYIDDYYQICLDDYFSCAWNPYPIFKLTSTTNYQYIPITGFTGQNANGNKSTLIKTTLTQHLNWLVANGSGYAYIPCWHTIFANVSDCRGTPYCDIDETTWKDCIDIIHEYATVGKNITVTTINSFFSQKLLGITTHDTMMDILPSMISIMMLGVAIAMLTKAKW